MMAAIRTKRTENAWEPLTDGGGKGTKIIPAGMISRDAMRALHNDAELSELARRPLMLSIFTLAYQGGNAVNFSTESTQEQTLHQVFDHYVERMLKRRGLLQSWTQERFLHWLHFLARQLHRRQQTVFSVEDLPPNWLPGKQQRLYWWSLNLVTGLPTGLIVGLIAVVVVGQLAGTALGLVGWLVGGLTSGWLAGGLLAGLFGKRDGRIQPAEAITWSWKKARNWLLTGPGDWQVGGLVGGMLIGWLVKGLFILQFYGSTHPLFFRGQYYSQYYSWLTSALSSWLTPGLDHWLLTGLLAGLLTGPISWLFVTSLDRLVNERDGRTQPAEAITWSWKKVRHGLLAGLLTGPASTLVGVSSDWLLAGLVGGLAGGLLIGLIAGLSVNQLTERVHLSPNEGIRRSGRNGLIVGLAAWLVVWLIVGQTTGLVVGQLVGLVAGLGFGLNAFAQHFVLRFWLWRTNCLTWNLVPFLDEAAERLLLRKVGGSYIFVHRLLLEYFATLDEPMLSESISSESKTEKL